MSQFTHNQVILSGGNLDPECNHYGGLNECRMPILDLLRPVLIRYYNNDHLQELMWESANEE
jgi:hypothetical protein